MRLDGSEIGNLYNNHGYARGKHCDCGLSAELRIGLGVLVATSTANMVAVPRTLPAMVMGASDTGGCCSASPSRRVLTLWSWSTSFRIASKTMGTPLSR